jgi:uncharacterized protein YndB with AHSA1/START domain
MNTIKHYLIINSSADIIYKAITEQKGLASWWTEDTIAVAEKGAIIDFIFGDQYHDKMLITNLVENEAVEWECTLGDPEWIGTKFKFVLEPKDEKTILRFLHYDWKDETDFFANCNYHWGYYLRSLKLYCETGEGTPFKK